MVSKDRISLKVSTGRIINDSPSTLYSHGIYSIRKRSKQNLISISPAADDRKAEVGTLPVVFINLEV